MPYFRPCYNICMKIRWGVNLVALTVALSAPLVAFAGGLPQKIVTCSGALDSATQKACTLCDLANTAQNILNTAIYILVVLSAILFAWAGFKMLFSGGDTSEYAAGKRIFGNVIIGLVIILAGWMVIDITMRTLLKQDPSWPWNAICRR